MKRAIFVAVFIVTACVLANESPESSEGNEKEGAKPVHPSNSAAESHSLECKVNETSGCQPCSAEKSCNSVASATAQACSAECKPACICKNGYVRSLSNQCILQGDCPH
ncbi:hypothetical protein GCK32_013896 [Trichostrongylus colubriformis]|uniref:TIL domain-containing protein n=1 Tax=Trichostrongylus colubriformis TaxID=6319 RepID=A0AAN8IT62_TRICO